jgi:hypothetical protein
MKKYGYLLAIAAVVLACLLTARAQWDKKPYTEWSNRDVQKILTDSPWGRTQSFTVASQLFNSGISGKGGIAGARAGSPPDRPSDAPHINFRVRFLSAKPIRQALVRWMEIKQKNQMNEQLAAQMKQFASGEFLEIIVVAVTCESDLVGENVQQAAALLRNNATSSLKNNTFLEIKGGQRIFLQEFQPPRPDGFGARFVFPRLVNDKPFITLESEEIHFYTELSDVYKLDRRFKVKDMMFDGKLEY